MQSLYI
nr:truncated vpu protein [Human immunodeficiency virus 1]